MYFRIQKYIIIDQTKFFVFIEMNGENWKYVDTIPKFRSFFTWGKFYEFLASAMFQGNL